MLGNHQAVAGHVLGVLRALTLTLGQGIFDVICMYDANDYVQGLYRCGESVRTDLSVGYTICRVRESLVRGVA